MIIDSLDVFGFDPGFEVKKHAEESQYIPKVDSAYVFDETTTRAILAGFAKNRRVLIHGLHGTGKTSHIEQVAARLEWPCLRINLDGYITRSEMIGRDHLTLKDGKQISEFKEGLLPVAMRQGWAVILDEYDAGRPDVLFVLQRLLEEEGKLTLLDTNEVITPHPSFRLFATSNTVGLGDASGLYHGTEPINQGQMDRWDLTVKLDFLDPEVEVKLITRKLPQFRKTTYIKQLKQMVQFAGLTRQGFTKGDLSLVMSPRTVLSWAKNYDLFNDLVLSFAYSFKNRVEPHEHPLLEEYWQRCFG